MNQVLIDGFVHDVEEKESQRGNLWYLVRLRHTVAAGTRDEKDAIIELSAFGDAASKAAKLKVGAVVLLAASVTAREYKDRWYLGLALTKVIGHEMPATYDTQGGGAQHARKEYPVDDTPF